MDIPECNGKATEKNTTRQGLWHQENTKVIMTGFDKRFREFYTKEKLSIVMWKWKFKELLFSVFYSTDIE